MLGAHCPHSHCRGPVTSILPHGITNLTVEYIGCISAGLSLPKDTGSFAGLPKSEINKTSDDIKHLNRL